VVISGAECCGDGAEDAAAWSEACGIDDGSDVGLALRSPHGAVAVGDFALDNSGTEIALAGIVGRFDLAGPMGERQELIFGAREFALKRFCQIARCRRGEDIADGPFQSAPPCGNRGWSEVADIPRQPERSLSSSRVAMLPL
jgi:hypothetical protein